MNVIKRGYYLGQKGKICSPHAAGVPLGMPPFYDPECPKCRQKLADGKLTGTEPHPSTVSMPYARRLRRGWALGLSTQGIAKREGAAAARAHRKIGAAV